MQFQDNVKIKKLQWILQVKNCGMSRVPKFVKEGRKERKIIRHYRRLQHTAVHETSATSGGTHEDSRSSGSFI